MKISIITVAFNAARTVCDTLQSVASQTHAHVEHIVVDGASTDGTRDIVAQNAQRVAVFVSEPDKGIYDAMNKGIGLATGEVIGFLNADDFYAQDTVLSDAAEVFADPQVDACFGDLAYVAQDNPRRIVRYWNSCPYQSGLFSNGWMPAHPTFFVRRSVYEKCGGFKTDYRLAADAELMIRFLAVYEIYSVYIPKMLVKMRMGGETNRSLSNVIRQNREIVSALRRHGLQVSWIRFLGHKLLSRGRQYLARSRT